MTSNFGGTTKLFGPFQHINPSIIGHKYYDCFQISLDQYEVRKTIKNSKLFACGRIGTEIANNYY
jgi:hypothetical protein